MIITHKSNLFYVLNISSG